jgi:hypothetical protein
MAWYWIATIVVGVLGIIVGAGYLFLRWLTGKLPEDLFNDSSNYWYR